MYFSFCSLYSTKISYLCTPKKYIMELISRPNYYTKIEKFLGKGLLIVLTGQRRVGKSYVMREIVQRKQQFGNACVIYINKEKTDFDFIQNHRDLVAYIDDHRKPGKHLYILIDEVQEIEEFTPGAGSKTAAAKKTAGRTKKAAQPVDVSAADYKDED